MTMAVTKIRYVRVDDDTWRKAKTRARAEGTTVSAVVRARLECYGNNDVSAATELARIVALLDHWRKRLEN